MKRSIALIMLLMGTSAAYGEIFTWKDSRGTAHYTNSMNEIPSKYLKKARVLDVATGKLGGPAAPQPAQGSAPGNTAAPGSQTQMAPAVIVPAPAQPAPVNGNGAPAQAAPVNPQGVATPPPASVTTAPQQAPTRQTSDRKRGARRHRAPGEEE